MLFSCMQKLKHLKLVVNFVVYMREGVKYYQISLNVAGFFYSSFPCPKHV